MCKLCDMKNEVMGLFHEKLEGPDEAYKVLMDLLSYYAVYFELPREKSAETVKRDYLDYFDRQLLMKEVDGKTQH